MSFILTDKTGDDTSAIPTLPLSGRSRLLTSVATEANTASHICTQRSRHNSALGGWLCVCSCFSLFHMYFFCRKTDQVAFRVLKACVKFASPGFDLQPTS